MNGDPESEPGPAGASEGPLTGGEETISTEVPALLAGVRADRGVAMVADVSRGGGGPVDRRRPGPGRRLPGHGGPGGAPRGVHPDDPAAGAPGGGRGRGTRRALRGGLRRRRGGGRGQAGGVGGASGRRARRGHSGRRSSVAVPRSGRAGDRRRVPARPARDRAPPRQGHLGPPRRRPDRRRLPGVGRPTGDQEHGTSLPGARRRRRGRRPGRGGGSHRTFHPHPDEDGGHRLREAGSHRLHGPGTTTGGETDHPSGARAPEREDASDPRAHGGDRTPGCRGRPLRRSRTSAWVRVDSSCMPSSSASCTP